MNKVLTLNLHLKNQLRIDQVLTINQLAKSYDGNVYFLTERKHIINAAKFPSLIAYLLTVKNGQSLKMIIDGPYPQNVLNRIEEISLSTAINQKEQLLQPALKIKL
ncbi:hypothetical protein [Metabacillus sediminilitoris]|uniref:HPr domain-containing protein n=1 Tax=Metabacillus sediminilitoris TaxID=2567941 RepID=A0A4S4BZR8_9BACI|nr:hypothetical protein [Metabacillus sediminilitoris]QGQ44497.1 hypothetical protein GMB29_04015 [Metabacillus sediminilitoris]THF80120.1 hypothetical protein E6W99_10630 [Metabacillus sediminilitoris]